MVRVPRVEIACFEGQKGGGPGINHVRWRSKDFGLCGSVQKVREKSVETSSSGLDKLVDPLGLFVCSEIGRVSDPKVGVEMTGTSSRKGRTLIPGCQQRSKSAPK